MTPITVTTEYPQWHHCSYPCVGLLSGWEGNVERQQGTWRQRKQWNAALSILQLFRLACICVRKRYVRPGVHRKRPFWKVSLLGGVNSSLTSPKKGTAADTGSYCMLSNFLFPSNNCGFFSANKVSTSTKGEVGRHFLGITSYPILRHCWLYPNSCWSSSSLWVFPLPPGEEGSSALETLCVGLAVGSLRCSGRFNNYWGHLDQL